MPAVFVHGVPDTPEVWDPLLSKIHRSDIVTLALPGSAAPLPAGFDASREAYLEWLLESLRRLDPPIDIVAHDWGAILTVRAVSLRPELFRSWTAGGGPLDPDYTWHNAAGAWQTPDVGEDMMAMTDEDALETALVEAGFPEPAARRTAARIDPIMQDCILRLYRSAKDVGREWSPGTENLRLHGLVLWGRRNDPDVEVESGRRLADRTGARFAAFEGCSHGWPLQRPDKVASELETFWNATN